MMDINLDLYKVFYETCKAGSISKAAEFLYISQPAISQAIKQLEEKLGGTLFIRTPRGVRLTGEGEVLYSYVDQALAFFKAGEIKFGEMKNLHSGVINIGASDTLSKYYLLGYLEKFRSEYPKITIHVTNRTTSETLQLLKAGQVDIGFVNMPVDLSENMEVKECMKIHDIFVAGKKYWEAANGSLDLENILRYPIMLLEKNSNSRKNTDRFFESNGIELKPEIELGSLDLLVEFTKIGLGISCIVKEYVKYELENGILKEIVLTSPIPQRSIGLVKIKSMPLSFAAKKFLELIF